MIFFLRVWSTFLLRLLSFLLWFLSCHYLTTPFHSRFEFSAFFPLPGLVSKHIRAFLLDNCIHTGAVSLQAAYIRTVCPNNRVHLFPCCFAWSGLCWVGFYACWAFLGLCSACWVPVRWQKTLFLLNIWAKFFSSSFHFYCPCILGWVLWCLISCLRCLSFIHSRFIYQVTFQSMHFQL